MARKVIKNDTGINVEYWHPECMAQPGSIPTEVVALLQDDRAMIGGLWTGTLQAVSLLDVHPDTQCLSCGSKLSEPPPALPTLFWVGEPKKMHPLRQMDAESWADYAGGTHARIDHVNRMVRSPGVLLMKARQTSYEQAEAYWSQNSIPRPERDNEGWGMVFIPRYINAYKQAYAEQESAHE